MAVRIRVASIRGIPDWLRMQFVQVTYRSGQLAKVRASLTRVEYGRNGEWVETAAAREINDDYEPTSVQLPTVPVARN